MAPDPSWLDPLRPEEYGLLSQQQQDQIISTMSDYELGGLDELLEVLPQLPQELRERIEAATSDYTPFIEMRRSFWAIVAAGPGSDDFWEFSPPEWRGMTSPPDDPEREWTEGEVAANDRHQIRMRAAAEQLARKYRALGY